MSLGPAPIIILAVALERLLELGYAGRNYRRLMTRGGRESGAGHYPLFILLHGGWLATLAALTDAETTVRWSWIGFFLVLQAFRIWVLASLGPYWTTRIVTLPDAAPVTAGPYRFLRHPNYLIVALEIPALPLAFGLPAVALAFGAASLLLLAYRIRVEDAARAGIRRFIAGLYVAAGSGR